MVISLDAFFSLYLLTRKTERSTSMKIAIGLPATLSDATGPLLLKWAREADVGPFSSLAVIDRLVYHNFDAFTTLATAAGATRRIRLIQKGRSALATCTGDLRGKARARAPRHHCNARALCQSPFHDEPK